MPKVPGIPHHAAVRALLKVANCSSAKVRRHSARRQQPPPLCRQVPVIGPAEPHLGLHALRVPIAPLGHRDGRRTVDEQARLAADLLQVGVVIRDEPGPALEIVTGRCQQGHQVGALGVRDFEERA